MLSFPPPGPLLGAVVVTLGLLAGSGGRPGSVGQSSAAPADEFAAAARPILAKHCLGCHSTKAKKGSLDLERFATTDDVRKDLKVWQAVVEQVEAGEMPPREKPQPTAEEKKKFVAWVRGFLDAEAKARSGDPGRVPLRRLSNAEYDTTIRDLTGVDLRPAREFPADGAAGEGFTNAAEALTDVSPALFTKYLNAAKDVSEHAVLLPDGFRFSRSKSRRDWTDEGTARLRAFYAELVPPDGKLPVQPYLTAAVRHRDALAARKFAEVAAKEKLNAKYLRILWTALNEEAPSHPLDTIRAKWRVAVEQDVPALVADVTAWQNALWKTVKIGNYIQASWNSPGGYVESQTRQVPVDPPALQAVAGGATSATADKQLVSGNAEFRKVFPLNLCFPQVVPTDEVVTLKMFHREDEPLIRLFLNEEQTRALDRLWAEQRFVSRQPVAEYDYLPQFMGYTTQDTPKAFQQFFVDRKPLFRKHAEEFLAEEAAAIPKQIEALLAFAERTYRRPLQNPEKTELRALYETIRTKGASHEEAFRGVIARVLVAPAFLFRVEQAPRGTEPGPVNDWELATRLSYFLWSSLPDDELRALAAAGKLRDPNVLAAQAVRMLKDPRARALAVEFGTQSIHVRGFDEFNEKNEKLFPTFNAELRKALYEEAVLFFLDLFQNDRPVTSLLDADHAFLNERLAKHYGIPNVNGAQFRKVDGVKKYGRGGVLGFGSVQAKQAGASRTSPVLRGNWVVETLLGEKLPKPPPNVPQLPEMEGADRLTTRQLVERHVADPSCATCHVRIDPFGFALEKFDPIGRLREKEVTGLAVDAMSKLRDGTEFEGIDGLRNYLLTRKKDVVVRLFCRRLLGYALGRSVTLSDTALLDEMVEALNRNRGRVGAAVRVIVKSPQFRMVRGSEFEK
jgi:mono/diheme cytochrome c family protein